MIIILNRLETAINEKRPFANFKSIVKGSNEVQRWYEFSAERRYQRAIKWLEDNNINVPSNNL